MQIDTSSPVATGLPAKAAPVSLPVQAPPTGLPAAPQTDADTLRNAASTANAAVKSLSNSLEFRIDQQSGRTVVRIVDAATQQLIRQLPSEEMLAIARALDKLQGMLIKDQA